MDSLVVEGFDSHFEHWQPDVHVVYSQHAEQPAQQPFSIDKLLIHSVEFHGIYPWSYNQSRVRCEPVKIVKSFGDVTIADGITIDNGSGTGV